MSQSGSASSAPASGAISTNNAESSNATASGIDSTYLNSIRRLLDAHNQIRSLIGSGNASIKLHTMVAIGWQSSGKSSVLEALSEVQLPRGQNMTTRCALQMRLTGTTGKDAKSTNSSSSSSSSESYAVISSSSSPGAEDEERIELSQVGAKIEEMTVKLTGNKVGVVDECIYLTVYRPNSPELTLIDLPGLTCTAVDGQPDDIDEQILAIARKYIAPQETVILNVMAANADLATNRSVKLAKEFDLKGKRTLAIFTKLDMAPSGIRDRLLKDAKQLNLRLGCVAVRNRSQEEVASQLSSAQARRKEEEYFRNHPELASLYKQLNLKSPIQPFGLHLGLPNLEVMLTRIQEDCIRQLLPQLCSDVRNGLKQLEQEVESMPKICTELDECRDRLDQLMHQFMSSCASLCRGDHAQAFQSMKPSGGSIGDAKALRVNPRMHELYEQYRSELAQSSSAFLTKEYATLVNDSLYENQTSCSIADLMSSTVFKQLMNAELEKCKDPTLKLIDEARQVCERVLVSLIRMTFVAYPLLADRIEQICGTWLDERQALLQQRVTETLEAWTDCFTIDSYHTNTVGKLKSALYQRLYNDRHVDQTTPEFALDANFHLLVSSTAACTVLDMAPGKSNEECSYFSVNDLLIRIDFGNITLKEPVEIARRQAACVTTGQQAISVPTNPTLDMQITCLAYCTLAHKRLADNLPMFVRLYFIRAFNLDSGAMQPGGLYLQLRKSAKELQDEVKQLMSEDSASAEKRDKITQDIANLKQAMKLAQKMQIML